MFPKHQEKMIELTPGWEIFHLSCHRAYESPWMLLRDSGKGEAVGNIVNKLLQMSLLVWPTVVGINGSIHSEIEC